MQELFHVLYYPGHEYFHKIFRHKFQMRKRGMNETRLKGNFIGGIPNYGYSLKEITTDMNGKQVRTALKVIINEEEAPILKATFV